MDIARQSISLPEWSPIIEEHLSSDQPIVNLVDGGRASTTPYSSAAAPPDASVPPTSRPSGAVPS